MASQHNGLCVQRSAQHSEETGKKRDHNSIGFLIGFQASHFETETEHLTLECSQCGSTAISTHAYVTRKSVKYFSCVNSFKTTHLVRTYFLFIYFILWHTVKLPGWQSTDTTVARLQAQLFWWALRNTAGLSKFGATKKICMIRLNQTEQKQTKWLITRKFQRYRHYERRYQGIVVSWLNTIIDNTCNSLQLWKA